MSSNGTGKKDENEVMPIPLDSEAVERQNPFVDEGKDVKSLYQPELDCATWEKMTRQNKAGFHVVLHGSLEQLAQIFGEAAQNVHDAASELAYIEKLEEATDLIFAVLDTAPRS